MIVHSSYCKHTFASSASMLNIKSCNNAYMKKIGEILKEARKKLDMSQEDVAKRVREITRDKFSRAALSQIESGDTKKPTPHNLQAACDALGIDFRSALNGKLIFVREAIEGEVVRSSLPAPEKYEDQEIGSTESIIAYHPDDPLPEGFISISKSKVSFSAGNGYKITYELIEDGKPAIYRLDWFIDKKINPNNVKRFEVVGDSMEPYLFHGNTILVNLADQTIKDGEVYAIRYEDQLRVKILQKKLDGSLVLRSYNEKYKEEEVPPDLVVDHISIIGRVIDRSGA
jgi:phage repressor protein C with HTH and peptisase S24 domain/DNA-binding XRE family transcriptional regulator